MLFSGGAGVGIGVSNGAIEKPSGRRSQIKPAGMAVGERRLDAHRFRSSGDLVVNNLDRSRASATLEIRDLVCPACGPALRCRSRRTKTCSRSGTNFSIAKNGFEA